MATSSLLVTFDSIRQEPLCRALARLISEKSFESRNGIIIFKTTLRKHSTRLWPLAWSGVYAEETGTLTQTDRRLEADMYQVPKHKYKYKYQNCKYEYKYKYPSHKYK